MPVTGGQVIRAPRGTELSCRGWAQEAALRMLMNNLDPEVAERPEDLVVYGGTGRAARSWEAYDAIVRTLATLEKDETLLVQSGKPVGVFRTNEWAPRVLIANSNLVGDWANWPEFRRLEAEGLMMYGQMTAGSWIYIGTQGILQGTFETFAAVADKRFGGTLAGTITLTAGLGGMGGAQPLAVTMNAGVAICVDVDDSRIQRRIEHRYLDVRADDLEHALELAIAARDERRPLSIGLLGNAAEVFPQLLEMRAPIDVVTDQTSAHDPLSYLPVGVPFEEWHQSAAADAAGFTKQAQASMAAHVRAMVEFQDAGAEVFDYGNSIRDEARKGGYDRAFEFPGFVPAYIRPLFCEGKGPFRWAALSGDPADIAATDRAVLELFPEDQSKVFKASLHIYSGKPLLSLSELAREMGRSEMRLFKARNYSLKRTLKLLRSLKLLNEDLLGNYELDVASNLITIDEAQAQRINEKAGTGFTPEFLSLLFGVHLESQYALLGEPVEVLAVDAAVLLAMALAAPEALLEYGGALGFAVSSVISTAVGNVGAWIVLVLLAVVVMPTVRSKREEAFSE